MGVERALVSEIVQAATILIVAMWSPQEMYIFTDPTFENRRECVEYVTVAHIDLNTHLAAQFGGPLKMNQFYCVNSESIKHVLDKENPPQI